MELSFNSLIDRAALGFLKSKKLLPGFSHYDVWLYEHAVAFTVAKMMDKDMLADVQAALTDAMQNGTTFAEFKQRLKPYLMAKGWWGESVMTDPVDGVPKVVQLGSTRRLRTIFHTNLQTSYAAGQWARVRNRKTALPYLKYIPSAATHKREAHKPYYNLILPVEHDLWHTIFPPNGYGCLCGVRQLTKAQALRERGEDIDKDPDSFTDAQKEAYKQGRIDDNPDIKTIEFTNPRTGQTVTIPADITPSFAHNHGDRVGALQRLFGERHGSDALDKMIDQRETYLSAKMRPVGVSVTGFGGLKADKSEIARLLEDGAQKKQNLHEAEAAALWQQAYGVKLERYDLPNKNPPDFMVVTDGTPETWPTLDFMFTADLSNEYKINGFNIHVSKMWDDVAGNIQRHLKKADIVPLDLRPLNALNRAKVITYVVSLPEEQRNKITLILGDKK
ncbi:phage minor head protein [Neisseria montereyensis]|uniref:Phage minor head protein n=1 Tax=Neisseria montereyensis TaxID=2973938 RepID=A0ABT2FDN5_9NEIS|nr:phage minor head protein [Neisseria montereyensis]MCS4534248.1 phage minor head protein [Neisseria montereyensis]